MNAHFRIAVVAAAMLTPVAAASAASVCYEVFDADTNVRRNQLVRLRTQAAGTLVPANEGGSATPAQSLFDVDGRFGVRTGLPLGQPQVSMHLATGFALVVPGKGAQMSLTRNFGRGFDGHSDGGFHIFDCGSTTASASPPTWVCRGKAILGSIGAAPSLRLTKVANPALLPDCRTFVGDAG